MMRKNDINRKCIYYNCGGNIERCYPSYPKVYGARCEFHDKFFDLEENNLSPICYGCKNKKEK